MSFTGTKEKIIQAYLVKIHENSSLHLKSYQINIDIITKIHKNTKVPYKSQHGWELHKEKQGSLIHKHSRKKEYKLQGLKINSQASKSQKKASKPKPFMNSKEALKRNIYCKNKE